MLTSGQLATPLLRRPYDLRHSGVTWRLDSGVPATEVAAWAGHSVEVLMRVYARCVAGLEDVWTARMDASLRPPGEMGDWHDQDGTQRGEGQRDELYYLRDKEKLPPESCHVRRRPWQGSRGAIRGRNPAYGGSPLRKVAEPGRQSGR